MTPVMDARAGEVKFDRLPNVQSEGFDLTEWDCSGKRFMLLMGKGAENGSAIIVPRMEVFGDLLIEAGAKSTVSFALRIEEPNHCKPENLGALRERAPRNVLMYPEAVRVSFEGLSPATVVTEQLRVAADQEVKAGIVEVKLTFESEEEMTSLLKSMGALGGAPLKLELALPVRKLMKPYQTEIQADFLAAMVEAELFDQTHINETSLTNAIQSQLPKTGAEYLQIGLDAGTYAEVATHIASRIIGTGASLVPKDEVLPALRASGVIAVDLHAVTEPEMMRLPLTVKIRGAYQENNRAIVRLRNHKGEHQTHALGAGSTMTLKPITLIKERYTPVDKTRYLTYKEVRPSLQRFSKMGEIKVRDLEEIQVGVSRRAYALRTLKAHKDSGRFHWKMTEHQAKYTQLSQAPFFAKTPKDLDTVPIVISFENLPGRKFTLYALLTQNSEFQAVWDPNTQSVSIKAMRDLGRMKIIGTNRAEAEIKRETHTMCQELWTKQRVEQERCSAIAYGYTPEPYREWTEIELKTSNVKRLMPSWVKLDHESTPVELVGQN